MKTSKEIKLANGTIIIDEEDYPLISSFHWHVTDKGYARQGHGGPYMHNLIVNKLQGLQVDHINHNKLDNRKENLRLVTQSTNQFNKPKPQKNNKTGVTGVFFRSRPPYSYWTAKVGRNKQKDFKTQEEAIAWREAQLEIIELRKLEQPQEALRQQDYERFLT